MLVSLKEFYTFNPIQVLTPQWKQYASLLHIRQEQFKKRYLQLTTPPVTLGRQLLEQLLEFADIEQLTRLGDNYYLYSTQIPDLCQNARVIFEKARSGKTWFRAFAFNQTRPNQPEYIVSPDDNNWPKILPLNKTSYRAWKAVRPLRLVWYTGTEQTFDLYTTGMLRFHNDGDTNLLWCLDVPALILKAVNWLKGNPDDARLCKFIQTEVIADVLDDVEDIWYRQLQHDAIHIALGYANREDMLERYPRSQTQYSYIGPRLAETLDESIEIYQRVQNNSLSVRAILTIPFYTQCTMSFSDTIHQMQQVCDISHHSQYKHLRLLRDMPYLTMLMDMYSLCPNHPRTQAFKIKLRVLVTKWTNDVPLSLIRNAQHRNMIAALILRCREFYAN